MKLKENVTVAARTYIRRSGLQCDACGKKTEGDDWGRDWNTSEVTISIATGESYPECGSKTTREWDLCPECFDAHIRPALEKFAPGEVTEVEW